MKHHDQRIDDVMTLSVWLKF